MGDSLAAGSGAAVSLVGGLVAVGSQMVDCLVVGSGAEDCLAGMGEAGLPETPLEQVEVRKPALGSQAAAGLASECSGSVAAGYLQDQSTGKVDRRGLCTELPLSQAACRVSSQSCRPLSAVTAHKRGCCRRSGQTPT